MKVNSKKVLISGIGWCYEVTTELKDKLIKKNINSPKDDEETDNPYGDVFEY